MLFETFQVWQDNDASTNNTAQRLFCHPNTERHRLRRIEKRSAGPSRAQEISPRYACSRYGAAYVTDASRHSQSTELQTSTSK